MSRQQLHLAQGEPTSRVSLRMPEELKRTLARIALEDGISENALMVRVLQEYVDKRTATQGEN